MFIDVLLPVDDFPRRPDPAGANDSTALEDEGEGGQHARLARAVAEWADENPDDDTWEGFYLSIDLIEELPEEDNDAT